MTVKIYFGGDEYLKFGWKKVIKSCVTAMSCEFNVAGDDGGRNDGRRGNDGSRGQHGSSRQQHG